MGTKLKYAPIQPDLEGEDLIRAVATAIRQYPKRYNQRWWKTTTDCNTTYCIAGWAAFIKGRDIDDTVFARNGIIETVAGWMHLDLQEAKSLFHGWWIPKHGMTVPEALEKIAAGASVFDVGNHLNPFR